MAAYDDLVAQVQAAVAKVQAHADLKAQLDAAVAERAELEAKLAALVEQLKPVTA